MDVESLLSSEKYYEAFMSAIGALNRSLRSNKPTFVTEASQFVDLFRSFKQDAYSLKIAEFVITSCTQKHQILSTEDSQQQFYRILEAINIPAAQKESTTLVPSLENLKTVLNTSKNPLLPHVSMILAQCHLIEGRLNSVFRELVFGILNSPNELRELFLAHLIGECIPAIKSSLSSTDYSFYILRLVFFLLKKGFYEEAFAIQNVAKELGSPDNRVFLFLHTAVQLISCDVDDRSAALSALKIPFKDVLAADGEVKNYYDDVISSVNKH
ncbi:hypothetical protein RCL1_002253 [Eukaryota sp. TZLM3-RCL]